jgi:NADPH-dependent ferric siderophore reductase
MWTAEDIAAALGPAVRAARGLSVVLAAAGGSRAAHRLVGRVGAATRSGFVVETAHYRVFVSYRDLFCRHWLVQDSPAAPALRGALDTLRGAVPVAAW